jgi:hypothetical protein
MALVATLVLVGRVLVARSMEVDGEERFCTLGLAVGPPLGDQLGMAVPQDQELPGSGPCDLPVDGSYSLPVVRGDDCTVVYPNDWTEHRRLLRIEPLNADGTCWRRAGR